MQLARTSVERILVCRPRGFCAGVVRAVEVVNAAIEAYGTPIYIRGEIIHNQKVIEDFRRRGVHFVNSLSEVPEGSILFFSAHGVAPQVREEAARRNLKVIDATCPLVTKVHREARWLSRHGYSVLLIGHAGHDEVVGISGEVKQGLHLITGVEDARTVQVEDPQRVGFLCQTTLSVSDAAKILRVLTERFPAGITAPKEDICYATQNRQNAVREVAQTADVFLVLGSANSSNSNRLREVAEAAGARAYLIENKSCLDPAWVDGARCIGVSSGASVPEVLVDELVSALEAMSGVTAEQIETAVETTTFILPGELLHWKPAAAASAGA
jgi:4-hydroxy-3-methylbut-2-enyl diphosphate reductase